MLSSIPGSALRLHLLQVLKQHNAIPDGAVVREKGQQAA